MRRSLCALAFLLLPAAAFAQETNLDKIQVMKRILSSTVKVVADFGNSGAVGTGVSVVNAGGGKGPSAYKLIVTNAHVVSQKNASTGAWELAPRIKVEPYGQKGKGALDAYVLFYEMQEKGFRDLAYLVVPDPQNLIGMADLPKDRTFGVGSKVYACGNPRSLEFFIDHGALVDVSTLQLPKEELDQVKADGTLFHDALTEAGNSGGGLFNEKGELIGINTWLFFGKTAAAQDIFRFFENHRLNSVTFSAQYGKPQELWSEYATRGQGVRALAFGRYTCAKGGPAMTAVGVPGNPKACLEPAFNFGSVLFKIAGTPKPFSFAYTGVGGRPVLYDDVALCDEMQEVGRFSFTLNDNFTLDNNGEITVVYLVTGPADLDVGLKVVEPTQAERDANKLWHVFSAGDKSTTYNCGAKVLHVAPNTEAEAAGLKAGDFILSCPGPTTTNDIVGMVTRDLVDSSTLGQHLSWARKEFIYSTYGVKLAVLRGGERLELTLRFGKYK